MFKSSVASSKTCQRSIDIHFAVLLNNEDFAVLEQSKRESSGAFG